jgi:hypothetical protein
MQRRRQLQEATAFDWIDDALEHLDLAQSFLWWPWSPGFDSERERDIFCSGILTDAMDSLLEAIAVVERDIAAPS